MQPEEEDRLPSTLKARGIAGTLDRELEHLIFTFDSNPYEI